MTNRPDWWREFFSGLVLDFVGESRDDETTVTEADFIEETLGLAPGASILDVPCGAGRLSLELAARGYAVTGVDLAQPLLHQAARQAKTRSLRVDWECRDMRDLPWDAQFDAALCWWSSFGYFDEAGNQEFLQAVSRCLRPGAPLLLDTPLLETRLPEMIAEERVWWPVGDLLALEERTFDHVTSRVQSQWTLLRDGQREQKSLSLRLYTYRELAQMLEAAGFSEHRAYGSLEWEPFELGAPWLYLLTRKAANA
jgi:SAM-dependent methyltransferase